MHGWFGVVVQWCSCAMEQWCSCFPWKCSSAYMTKFFPRWWAMHHLCFTILLKGEAVKIQSIFWEHNLRKELIYIQMTEMTLTMSFFLHQRNCVECISTELQKCGWPMVPLRRLVQRCTEVKLQWFRDAILHWSYDKVVQKCGFTKLVFMLEFW